MREPWQPTRPVLVAVGFGLGVAVTWMVATLLPSVYLLAIVPALATLVGVLLGALWSRGKAWPGAVLFLPVAVTLVGAVELDHQTALAERGEQVRVVVAEHLVDESNRATRHTYVLRKMDGTPLGEHLVYRGSDGFDLDTGDTTTVVIDPEREVDLDLATEVEPGFTRELLLGGSAFVLVFLLLLAFLPPPRAVAREAG